MNILYKKTFVKDLRKIKDKKILSIVSFYINQIKQSNHIKDIQNVSKLKGHKAYYRIRIENYRLGFKIEEDSIICFIRFLKREDVYNVFLKFYF